MATLMEPLRQQLVGVPRQVTEISAIIGKMIATNFNMDVIHAEATEVDVNDINLSATYDPDLDSMNRPCIELFIVFNPLDTIMVIEDDQFDTVVKRLCDSISHEQIHQQQHRARYWESWGNDADEDEAAYLSNKDEIDAYSHNIANELLDYTDYQNVLTLLARPSTIQIEHSINLFVYIKIFGNTDHPVIKRLLKKIIRKLPNVVYDR